MANKKRCRHCKDYLRPEDGIIVPVGFYCCIEHAREHTRPKAKAITIKRNKVAKKAKQKGLITRTQWYSKLQKVENQYIVHVRDKDQPCFTCGTQSQNIKYDCGHYIHAGRGGGDRRRFIEMNLHKQCSVQCNQHGGGMPEVYAQRITEVYGADKLTWLKGENNHPLLKELFPHWSDVENEINRYRQLLRDNGLRPNV